VYTLHLQLRLFGKLRVIMTLETNNQSRAIVTSLIGILVWGMTEHCGGAERAHFKYFRKHGPPLPCPTISCMPTTIRFKLRGPCAASLASPRPQPPQRPSIQPAPLPRASPRTQLRRLHTCMLRMDVRDLSEGTVQSGDGLKLTNRLNESRSPYVSASVVRAEVV